MNLQESQRLIGLIQEGAQLCVQRLARICRAEWSVAGIRAGTEAQECFEALCTGGSQDHFGSYISLPGGAFLVLFDRCSGLRVCTRFLGDFSDQASYLERLEPTALCEISSILVNALVEKLACAGGETLILSAPEPIIDDTRELLRAALRKFRTFDKVRLTCHVRLACSALSCAAALVVFLDADLVGRILGDSR